MMLLGAACSAPTIKQQSTLSTASARRGDWRSAEQLLRQRFCVLRHLRQPHQFTEASASGGACHVETIVTFSLAINRSRVGINPNSQRQRIGLDSPFRCELLQQRIAVEQRTVRRASCDNQFIPFCCSRDNTSLTCGAMR